MAVPSVAQRREDIPLLVEEFVQELARRTALQPKRVSEEAMQVLTGYDWPGNVREIRNLVERLMIMVSGGEITPEHLDLQPAGDGARWNGELLPLKEARERFERHYVEQVVEACGNNMSQAARVLGLERSHFYRKLRALGLLRIDRSATSTLGSR